MKEGGHGRVLDRPLHGNRGMPGIFIGSSPPSKFDEPVNRTEGSANLIAYVTDSVLFLRGPTTRTLLLFPTDGGGVGWTLLSGMIGFQVLLRTFREGFGWKVNFSRGFIGVSFYYSMKIGTEKFVLGMLTTRARKTCHGPTPSLRCACNKI